MHNKKIQKLTLARETVRNLTKEDLGQIIGGRPTRPSQGGSECESVMLCATMFCPTNVFC
jgi:hypothetical protein